MVCPPAGQLNNHTLSLPTSHVQQRQLTVHDGVVVFEVFPLRRPRSILVHHHTSCLAIDMWNMTRGKSDGHLSAVLVAVVVATW